MKLKTYLTCAALICAAFAYGQQSNRRVVLHLTNGTTYSVLPERLDSISFPEVEGEVSATATLGNTTESSATFSIALSEACVGYTTYCAETDEMATLDDQYIIDRTAGQELSADTECTLSLDAPGTNYTAAFVAYDSYGTPCTVTRADFSSAEADIIPDFTGNWRLTGTSLSLSAEIESTGENEYMCRMKYGNITISVPMTYDPEARKIEFLTSAENNVAEDIPLDDFINPNYYSARLACQYQDETPTYDENIPATWSNDGNTITVDEGYRMRCYLFNEAGEATDRSWFTWYDVQLNRE